MKLHIFIVHLGTGIILIAFFIAIYFTKKEKPSWFKYILTYIILGLIISANSLYALYFGENIDKIAYLIERTLILFQFISLALFFIGILRKSKFIGLIKKIFYLSILIQIALLIATIIKNFPLYNKISSHLFLIIFSFFYYRELLNNKPTTILVKSSAFWIVTGIFFSYCISFPIHALHPFIAKIPEYINIRSKIFAVSNISLIVFFLFIIKSYLCLKHPQN